MDHLSTLPFVPPVLWHSLFPSGKTYMSAVRTCNETCRDIIRRRQQERADPAYAPRDLGCSTGASTTMADQSAGRRPPHCL